MISSSALQNAYNTLYTEFRRYIWGFDAANALADLEIASYEACADINKVRTCLDKLNMYARDVIKNDEDLKKAFDSFYDLLKDEESTYVKLLKVNEEVPNESRKVAENTDTAKQSE